MNYTVSRSEVRTVLAFLREGKPDRLPLPLNRRLLARRINQQWGQLRRWLRKGGV